MSRNWLLPVLLVLVLFGCDSGSNDESPSFCDSDPCGEYGTCAEGVDGPVCVCEPGYASSDGGPCEAFVGVCGAVSCGDHGLCVDANGEAACLCDDGYEVVDGACAAIADPCGGIDCGDNGECVLTVAGTATCLCDEGYYLSGIDCFPKKRVRDGGPNRAHQHKGRHIWDSTIGACLTLGR